MTPLSDAAASNSHLAKAEQVLRAVAHDRGPDFSGVGIVFYERLALLPHLQLTNNSEEPDAVRFAGCSLEDALLSVSSIGSPLHDGFHFVDVASWTLTHLSQFISPPIPHDAAQHFHGTGARLMAALLASLQSGIACVGLVSQGGEVHLFTNGFDAAAKD